MGSKRSDFGDGASPGKIFIGGLAKDTTLDAFVKYFGKYGEITDSVIMKDRHSGRPRGFGFITYADPSVVDTVIAETHVINGKQVEIKRTIPKGSGDSKDFKTKKIFVGGIPTSVNEDDFKGFFSKFGKVVEHEIIRDHVTKRSRGFGFIVFDNEQVVDNILTDGNMIDMSGTQVEIKKAEPKKPSNPPSAPAYGSDSRGRGYGDSYGSFNSSYSSFGSGGFGPASYRSMGSGFGGRFGDYGGYGGGSDFGGRYGDYASSEFGYRESPLSYSSSGLGAYGRGGGYGGYGGTGASVGPYFGSIRPLSYSSRFGSYGGSFGGGQNNGLGAYGRGGGYGGYGGAGASGGPYFGSIRPLSYSSRFGSYGGSFGGGYSNGLGAHGRGGGYGGYGHGGDGAIRLPKRLAIGLRLAKTTRKIQAQKGLRAGGGNFGKSGRSGVFIQATVQNKNERKYESGPGASYGGSGGGLYGGRAGYSGSSRYHPYAR